jgi:phage terminase large subunit-like protein
VTLPSVGLVQACDDAQLLAFGAYPRQRELLALLEASPMVVACCGRRSGKTRAASAAALHNLLLTPELDAMVGPGERRYALSIANSKEQARIFVDHARALVHRSPLLRPLLLSETTNELVFEGNRVLAAFPCSARTGRGYAASFILLDEFAHFFDDESGEGAAVASRVYSALVPSVATFGEHGRVFVASTPLGIDGLFAELYAKAENGEMAAAGAFHAPTREMNLAVTAAFLEGQRLVLGDDDFEREYEAVFVAGGQAFIDSERLRAAVAERRFELPVHAGKGWTAALDPSFARDPTALVIVGRDPFDRERLVVGYAGRWLPPKQRRRLHRSPEEQSTVTDEILDGVAEVLRRYELRTVITDQHLPGVVTHELGKRGIGVIVMAWSASNRTEKLQALRARIHTGRVELYDPPGVPLLVELQRLRTRYRAGSSTVEVPRVADSHSDVALALAAAVFSLDRGGAAGNTDLAPQRRDRWGNLVTASGEVIEPALSAGLDTKVF